MLSILFIQGWLSLKYEEECGTKQKLHFVLRYSCCIMRNIKTIISFPLLKLFLYFLYSGLTIEYAGGERARWKFLQKYRDWKTIQYVGHWIRCLIINLNSVFKQFDNSTYFCLPVLRLRFCILPHTIHFETYLGLFFTLKVIPVPCKENVVCLLR